MYKVSYVEAVQGVATVYVVVLMVVVLLVLELIMNHIDIDEEYKMGSSIVSFDSFNDESPVGSLLENILNKIPDKEVGRSGRGT